MIYNIAYGTGCPDGLHEQLLTVHRYLKTQHGHLERIISFIKEQNPDLLGLVEIDTGSYRTNFVNQVQTVAGNLNAHVQFSVKYGKRSLGRVIPIMNKQGNALISRKKIAKCKFHYFPRGMKKLIIEANIDGIRLFLVHLALQKGIRAIQLDYLSKLARKGDWPLIIAGDFNTFSGTSEIEEFQNQLGLLNPNTEGKHSYPSWAPRLQLDFVLCSPDIKIDRFEVPDVRYSDHLPLLLDFHL